MRTTWGYMPPNPHSWTERYVATLDPEQREYFGTLSIWDQQWHVSRFKRLTNNEELARSSVHHGVVDARQKPF